MAVAFLLPLAGSGVDRLKVDFADQMAAKSGDLAKASSSADLLLVGWNNAALEDVRIPLLQERLLGALGEDGIRRGGSPYLASVTTPVDRLRQIIDKGVSPDVAYATLIGSLIGPGKLNVTLTEPGRLAKDGTIRTIVEQAQGRLGVELRVSSRTIPFFPEEDDKLFETLSVKLPEGIKASAPSEHDLELTWDGIHNPESVRGVQTMLTTLVGYPTADSPNGVSLVASAERRAGLPVALEIRLSPAGLMAPAAALAEIQQRATECRIPAGEILLIGEAVALAAQHQGMLAALSGPAFWGPISTPTTIPAAALLILVGVLLIGLRSPARVLISLCLVAVVALLTLGGFGLARIPLDLPAVCGILGGIAASLSLLIGASTPSTDANSPRLATRSAALLLLVGSAILMAVPSPSLRAFAIAMAGMTALTFALLETNVLPVSSSAAETGTDTDFTLLLKGHGRWIGRGGLAVAALAATGLWFARPNLDLGRLLSDAAPLSSQTREANDALAGTNLLETTIRFDRSAQDRLRFLERVELIRGVEADLRKIAGVTGVFSAADLYPSRTLEQDASPRERIAFNRLSRTLEEQVRGETSAETASLLSQASTAPGSGRTDETWTIRVHADATASLDGLLKQVGTVIPQTVRLEPGVQHQIAGAPLARAAHLQKIRLSLIIMAVASLVAATVVVAVLFADLPTSLAMTLPSFVCQAAVLGVFAFLGKPFTLLSVLSACGVAILSLSGATRILCDARRRLREHRDVVTALGAALAESSRTLISLTMSLAGAALAVGLLSPTFLGEAAFVTAAGLVAGLVGTMVILPALVVGRLERHAPPEVSDEASERQTPVLPSPLRRTA